MAIREKGMLKDITFVDVLKELRERPLSEEEMVACLQWWIGVTQKGPAEINNMEGGLLGAAVLTVSSSDDGDRLTVPLGTVRTFLNPEKTSIPADGPLPNHLLPMNVSRKLDLTQLRKSLPWEELTVLDWVRHIADPAVYTRKSEFNIVESQVWAGRILQVLGRCWQNLDRLDQRVKIIRLLGRLTCIPTSAGMKRPNEAHFSNGNLFHNLPVVNLPSGVEINGYLKDMLADLGVRKYVDPQVILDRWVPHSPTPHPSNPAITG